MTRVAAIQMDTRVGAIRENIAQAEAYLHEAVEAGARVIALPEFFTTPIVENEELWRCSLPPDNLALDLLRDVATTHGVLVGGSYLEKRGPDIFNCYVLVRPDGVVSRHDKDLPTMIENAYYRGGSDDGLHQTSFGRVGTAVCWETIRTQTVKRLEGKIDFVITGSHWWAPPVDWKIGRRFMRTMDRMNREIMRETPARFAQMLGVANIHAAHCGPLRGTIPLWPKGYSAPFNSYLVGETQIIDNQGAIVARRSAEEGPGVIYADIDLRPSTPRLRVPDRFWIPQLPLRFRVFWQQQNWCGKALYEHARSNGLLSTVEL